MELDPRIASETAWLFWEVIVKEIIRTTASAAWKRYKDFDGKQDYQKSIQAQYATMRVLDKLEPVPMDEHYVDLFVLEKPEAYQKYGIDHLEASFEEAKGFYNRSNRSDAQLIVIENNRLFVLGKPGAGKTTFLKYLALRAADERIGKAPIFISFNTWAYSQKGLFDFIVEQFDVCGFPDAGEFIELLLNKGEALILFDGLDEVSGEANQRGNMIYELENLIKKYPNNKFVISCRNAANDYSFEGFTYVEIADLTDYQVTIFAQRWFKNDSRQSNEFIKKLAADENQSLREISHNPLLLGMLCLVYEETSNFPPRRGMVYRDAIDVLTNRWDKTRGIQRSKIIGFTPSVEKRVLSFLAYNYSLENKVFFDQDNLEKRIEEALASIHITGIESTEVLSAIEIQHGLLSQRARRVYTFSHLTFQEYFTAQHIIDQVDSEQNLLDNLFTRLYDQRWKEVFPLVAGLISTPDTFFEKFLHVIREPVLKNRVLVRFIRNIDELASILQVEGDVITARMRTIALVITVSRMFHVIQRFADERIRQMAQKVLRILNTDESVIKSALATEVAKIITTGSTNRGKNREKINRAVRLAAKYSEQTDFDMGHSYPTPIINLDNMRAILREQLNMTDELLTQRTKQEIPHILEKRLSIDTAYKIVLDFKPSFPKDFVTSMNALALPRTFANNHEWLDFKYRMIQSLFRESSEQTLEIAEEHLFVLDKFIRGNIFLLDCLRQSNYVNDSSCAFSITPFAFQGR